MKHLVFTLLAALVFSGVFASGDPVPDVKGKTLDEAAKVTNQEIAEMLGGLPLSLIHI